MTTRKGVASTASKSQLGSSTMSETRRIFTIGHSTRSIPEFIELLRLGQVELVVDIRSVPRSRRNPAYNIDVLAAALAPDQIAYTRIAALGGLRSRSKVIPREVNGYWLNQSFHNYADYALTGEFRTGLEELLALAANRRVAIMCAEAVWWRCHRRIVADYLLHEGRDVVHLMGSAHAVPASITLAARAGRDGLVYPAAV